MELPEILNNSNQLQIKRQEKSNKVSNEGSDIITGSQHTMVCLLLF